jgi:transposase InsO family protein
MPWKVESLMNQRTEFVLKSLQTDNLRALCQEYGISPKTGYKWRERFIWEGLGGLHDLSRRPASSPRGLEEAVICEIVRLKNVHRSWGPRKIRAVYARVHGRPIPSESSFKRVLERAGLVAKRRLRRRSQAGRLASGRQATAPNEVWTVDFKGWWHDRQGRRCEPLTVRDEFTRYLLELRAMPDARTETVRESFERLFERQGLPGAMRSDNGVPFASSTGVLGLSRLSAWWVVLGIDLERSRPACPQDNGAHERLHLDIHRELEGHVGAEGQASLDEWRRIFNEERPHEALGMRCPAELYGNSGRRYEGTPEDLDYDRMATRRIANSGYLCLDRQSVFISSALSGWSVGLESIGAGRCNVWFGNLLIGQLDEKLAAFHRADANGEPAA